MILLATMTFADILLVALSSALLGVMLDLCMDEGMIFERWGNWCRNGGKWYHKILGGCIYCTQVYISVITITLYLLIPLTWSVVFSISLAFFLIHLVVFSKILD